MLPDSIKSAGVVSVATTATTRPAQFMDTDGKTIIGITPDLLAPLGELLGVKFKLQVVGDYGAILSGIKAGRYDAGAVFGDTKEREATVDFVVYFKTGLAFYSRPGEKGDAIPCGKSVGVGNGGLPATAIKKISETDCVGKGKPAIDIKTFQNNSYQEAVASGQIFAALETDISAGYLIKLHPDKFALLGKPFDEIPAGIAVSKDMSGLSTAMVDGINKLIKNGKYKTVFDKWGVANETLDKASLNVAGAS